MGGAATAQQDTVVVGQWMHFVGIIDATTTSIYKNGVLFRHVCGSCVSEASSGVFITIMDACNGTDYYEVFAYGVTAGNTYAINASAAALGTFFMGTTL